MVMPRGFGDLLGRFRASVARKMPSRAGEQKLGERPARHKSTDYSDAIMKTEHNRMMGHSPGHEDPWLPHVPSGKVPGGD